MNSPNLINYELRPAKFTERKMILASLLNVCKVFGHGYQYIGFGGISFTDFKLFHKELHIDQMYSIEGGERIEHDRCEFNCPYSFIKLKFGKSTEELIKLDFERRTVVWLDYDDDLQNFMFEDVEILFRKLPVGSIFLMSCNRQLKDVNGEIYSKESFERKFGDYVPYDLKNKDLGGEQNFKTIRRMYLNIINSVL